MDLYGRARFIVGGDFLAWFAGGWLGSDDVDLVGGGTYDNLGATLAIPADNPRHADLSKLAGSCDELSRPVGHARGRRVTPDKNEGI